MVAPLCIWPSATCGCSPVTPPHGSWTLPCCHLAVAHAHSGLRPLFYLFPLHRMCFPQILAWLTSSPFLSLCFTITLLMRLSLTFLLPHLLLHRYLYFLCLYISPWNSDFITCQILHCLPPLGCPSQQGKDFCLFSFLLYL